MACWRNFIKGLSERKPDPTTPAMLLGLTDRPWDWPRLLAQRLFLWQHDLPPAWTTIYRRRLITPEVGRNLTHEPVYAI